MAAYLFYNEGFNINLLFIGCTFKNRAPQGVIRPTEQIRISKSTFQSKCYLLSSFNLVCILVLKSLSSLGE